jgi:RNA polymerase-binding protein DksA
MNDHLSAAERDELRSTLKQRSETLLEEIRQALLDSDDEHYVDLAGRVHDLEEASVADLLVDLGLADIDRLVQEVREAESALMRMGDGSYGLCEECGRGIPVERLRSTPAARRCIGCQEAFERTHAQPGQPSL